MVANLEVEKEIESVIRVGRKVTNAEIAHNETGDTGRKPIESLDISIILFQIRVEFTLS